MDCDITAQYLLEVTKTKGPTILNLVLDTGDIKLAFLLCGTAQIQINTYMKKNRLKPVTFNNCFQDLNILAEIFRVALHAPPHSPRTTSSIVGTSPHFVLFAVGHLGK